ncbi:MAG TPA: 30S ribosomal protein S20 [Gemmatimonadales bacterium]
MPRTTSAKKALRQTKHRTAQNKAQRSRLRTAVKAVRAAQTPEAREAAFHTAERLLDRAGRKGLVHPNVAARLKRRLKKGASHES